MNSVSKIKMGSQTEQWWQRGGFNWLHFRQYLTLGLPVSFRGPGCSGWLANSGPVKGEVSPLSSSIGGLQFGGTLPGSVNTTEK